MDLRQRGVGQRVAQRLAVAVPGPLDAEDRPRRGPGRERNLRADVAGENAAEIVAEADEHALGIGQIPMRVGPWRGTPGRAAPARHPVRFLVPKGGQDSFAGIHDSPSCAIAHASASSAAIRAHSHSRCGWRRTVEMSFMINST